MLVQALGLFALDSLDMLPAAKVSAAGTGGGAPAVPVADAHVCDVAETCFIWWLTQPPVTILIFILLLYIKWQVYLEHKYLDQLSFIEKI